VVSFNPKGSHNHPARDACALASGGFSLLLAVEIVCIGRAAADRDGPTRTDSADERRKSALGSAAYPPEWTGEEHKARHEALDLVGRELFPRPQTRA
jgi:hypothetical protein